MKTVFKRLLSLALAAMMLVSVMPFQASAAGELTFNFAEGSPIAVDLTAEGGVSADWTDAHADDITKIEAVETWVNANNQVVAVDLDSDVAAGTLYEAVEWTVTVTTPEGAGTPNKVWRAYNDPLEAADLTEYEDDNDGAWEMDGEWSKTGNTWSVTYKAATPTTQDWTASVKIGSNTTTKTKTDYAGLGGIALNSQPAADVLAKILEDMDIVTTGENKTHNIVSAWAADGTTMKIELSVYTPAPTTYDWTVTVEIDGETVNEVPEIEDVAADAEPTAAQLAAILTGLDINIDEYETTGWDLDETEHVASIVLTTPEEEEEGDTWTVVIEINGEAQEDVLVVESGVKPTDTMLNNILEDILGEMDLDDKKVTKSSWDKNEDDLTATIEVTIEDKEPEENRTATLYVGDEAWDTVYKNKNTGKVNFDNGPKIANKKFVGWFSKEGGKGNQLQKNMDGKILHEEYFAHYIKSSDDGLSRLKVIAVFYVEGVKVDTETVYNEYHDEEKTLVLKELFAAEDEIMTKVEDFSDAHYNGLDFKWNGKFYNESFDDNLTSQKMDMSDNVTVYIKLDAADHANVSLEIHTKVSSTAQKTVWLKGYLEGMTVERDDVIDVVKKYYNVSSKNVKMYSDDEWDDLVDNDKDAKTTEEIEVKGDVTKVHVLLSGASEKGNADSSNPKTGDGILMAVTVMGISASALVVLYFLNKKKQNV